MKQRMLVINACFGGYSLSEAALRDLNWNDDDEYRKDTRENLTLINLIQSKGSKYVSGRSAKLKIVVIETDFYEIHDYDGYESVICSNSPITWVG